MEKKIKISINQINTESGNIKDNFSKITKDIEIALANDCDIIVFPETAITGYCVGSLWDNIDFIFEQENLIRNLIKNIPYDKTLIIGYVSYHGTKPDGFPLLKNSVAVINQNKLQRYDKQLLANADHHEDKKYFKAGKKTKIFDIKLGDNRNIKIGVPICEDAWYTNHHRNIPKEMVDMGAELLIIPNQSYFYYGKDIIREKLFSSISKLNNVPVVTVNSVGVGDIVKNIIIFDGSSMCFDKSGSKFIQLKKFEEESNIFELDFSIVSQSKKYLNPIQSKYEEIIKALIFEQKEFFRLLGIKKAQVHLSGGIDSTIIMAICILAMGKDNCVFITNPSSLNSTSLKMVDKLCKIHEVKLYTNELEDIFRSFVNSDKLAFGHTENDKQQKSIETVFQAVGRTVQGLAASHRFNSGIVATGNHTEIVWGWCNFHDIGSVGVHAPIGDLSKSEEWGLSMELNKFFNKEVIPVELFNGDITPAAELPDVGNKPDPIDYNIQSGLCTEVIRYRKTKNQLINDYKNRTINYESFADVIYGPFQKKNKPFVIYDEYTLEKFTEEVEKTISRQKISVFKAAQHAPNVLLSPRSRGFSNRETLINKYY